MAVTKTQPPSGGCVLKHQYIDGEQRDTDPAAFRRLCVETKATKPQTVQIVPSRLQAAVC